ncbi:MAG TPA: biotin carboxylase N-terminal domain-containing protein [Acidimicrobiales bacterium]|nr:biotin carboxylase N-terminal domain-containing protein [Acidimicrobiales bacterium]
MFDTVMVANRGEIAVRIFATLRRFGVRSIGVYSDEDLDARHVREADVAMRLGPAPARESYLNIERVIDAALASGAQAIHPGYGFLSENAHFVRACEEAGLTFIGPSAESVEVMGDKIRAKAAVARAGVAVVPGCGDSTMSNDDLLAAARDIGYPLLVKPSAGGGGKGMHLVNEPSELERALVSARREASVAFGEDALLLERYLVRPRHLEVQILADHFGHAVHLFERECSLQRRHQKVIEEAPSPWLSDASRAALCDAALRVGAVVDYRGVGTVEFIASSAQPDEFFFMEMNTRLQVEHPVTEFITGIDLVEQQLRVAAGEALSCHQDDVVRHGHAIEARVYAEDPARNFLPTGGYLLALREPHGDGVRVDSSLLEGTHVATTYDPMLAKVIAHGTSRDEALARLDDALATTMTLGVSTNVSFLRTLVRDDEVRAGRLDTELIARLLDDTGVSSSPARANVGELAACLALSELLSIEHALGGRTRFDVADGWRVGEHAATKYSWRLPDDDPLEFDVGGTWRHARVTLCGEHEELLEVMCASWDLRGPGVYEIVLSVNDVTTRAVIGRERARRWIWHRGETTLLRAPLRERDGVGASERDGVVRSPMPGVVIDVRAHAGEVVSRAQALVVVEAMKMEHALLAPHAGTLRDVLVAVGDQVVLDQIVATVSAAPPAPA